MAQKLSDLRARGYSALATELCGWWGHLAPFGWLYCGWLIQMGVLVGYAGGFGQFIAHRHACHDVLPRVGHAYMKSPEIATRRYLIRA